MVFPKTCSLSDVKKWMKSFKAQGTKLVLLSSLMISVFAFFTISFATDKHHIVTHETPPPAAFIDYAFIDQYLKKYEELRWFGSSRGEVVTGESPSVAIFGQKIPAFDKTVRGLKNLSLFLHGKYDDYLEFVIEQEKDKRLEWNEFQQIQNNFSEAIEKIKGLSFSEVVNVLELAIVLQDIQSTEKALNKAAIYEISMEDKELFIDEVIVKHLEIFPSSLHFSLPMKELLSKLIKLTSIQQESMHLYAAFSTFDAAKRHAELFSDAASLELSFFLNLCEVAAEKNDSIHQISPQFTKYTYRVLQIIKKSLGFLSTNNQRDAYQFYLDRRADLLDLDARSPLNRILTIVGSMMHLYTKEEGKVLKETFLKLPPEDLSLIITEFDEGKTSHISPSLQDFLSCLAKSTIAGKSSKEKLSDSLLIGFPFFIKASRIMRANEKNKQLPLNFSSLLQTALFHPELIKEGEVVVDERGNVLLKN